MAAALLMRRGSGQSMPLPREMLHQAEEERQIVAIDPLFVERQDVGAPVRVEQEIGILHALGNALVGQQRADVIILEERAEFELR